MAIDGNQQQSAAVTCSISQAKRSIPHRPPRLPPVGAPHDLVSLVRHEDDRRCDALLGAVPVDPSRNQMSSTQSVVISDALLGAVPVDRLAAGSPICEVVDDDEPACQERRVEMQSVAIRCDPRNQTSSAVRTWREPRVEHGERLVGGPIRIAVESYR